MNICNIYILKKVVLGFIILFTTLGFSQGAFDSLEDQDDVSTVVVNKDMFDLLKKFPDTESKDMKLFNALKGLSELKIFSTNASVRAESMESMVKKVIQKDHLRELMRTKDQGSSINVYVKSSENKDIVNNVLLFIKHSENQKLKTSILTLSGKIDVNELAKMAKEYNK